VQAWKLANKLIGIKNFTMRRLVGLYLLATEIIIIPTKTGGAWNSTPSTKLIVHWSNKFELNGEGMRIFTSGLLLILNVFLISFVISLTSSTCFAITEDEANQLNILILKNGIEIQLPKLPDDENLRIQFLQLSPAEQQSFYIKRQFLIKKMTTGLTNPGFKSGLRWVKNQLFSFKDFVINEFTGAQTMVGQGDDYPLEISRENLPLLLQLRQDPKEAPNNLYQDTNHFGAKSQLGSDHSTNLQWQKTPENLSPEAKAFVESTITGLVQNMWKNCSTIAKSNGLGLTFVGGTIFNTTLGKRGFYWGRSLSIDVGIDFQSETGYIRFLYDREALKSGGLSFDVGLMFKTLVHITDTEVRASEEIEATHVKLPIIGCFRDGPKYKAWGAEFAFTVFEMLGGWLTLHGFPVLGPGLVTGSAGLGAATLYSTNLHRKTLKVYQVPQSILKATGLKKLIDLTKELKQRNMPLSCKDVI
jgi:hypothetical protein